MHTDRREGVVWIIGGGSGIGRATALRLARGGRPVVVSGRNRAALDETASMITDHGGTAWAHEVDVTDRDSVGAAHKRIVAEAGRIETLVFGAGTNLGATRWWETLDAESFAAVVDTNLTAAATTIAAVLPDMRHSGGGRVFVIGSWAGWRFMSVAGAAYAASKSGLSAIVESLNDQEGRSGVRATLVVPGEVNTEILRTRPVPPTPSELDALLDPDDVAVMIEHIADLPFRVCVNEVVISGVLNGIYLRDSKYPGPTAIDLGARR